MATLLMNILDNDRSGWGNKPACIYRIDPSKPIVMAILSFWDHPLLITHMRHKYFPQDSHSNVSTYLPLSQNHVAVTFYSCSFQVWHHQGKLFTLYNWYISCSFHHHSFWVPFIVIQLRRFALIMISQSNPKRGCHSTYLHFIVVPEYHTESYVRYKAMISFGVNW